MSNSPKALILAGGLGTRLREVVNDRPKPMALISGKPFLEHQINFLEDQRVREIILAVGYQANVIKSYFGTGGRFGVDITYSEEDSPLGTAGAVKHAEKYIDDTFYVLNGDTFSQINLQDFLDFHKTSDREYSMCLSKLGGGREKGKVVLQKKKIKEYAEKGGKGNFTNRGIYLFNPSIFNYLENGKNISLEEEVFPDLAKKGRLGGYLVKGDFIDIGRPETYERFKKYFMEKLFLGKDANVKDALQKIDENRTGLVLVVDKDRILQGVATNRGINRFLYQEQGSLESRIEDAMFKKPDVVASISDGEDELHKKLSGVNVLPIVNEQGKIQDILFKEDEIKKENFPVIRGKAPLRISFAGGGTDLPHYFENHGGGIVINTTINKHCHGTATRRADNKRVINSDLGEEIILEQGRLIYDGKFDLIKAVINIINPQFGFELNLYNDVPPGRGLGSSASFSVLVASLLSGLENAKYDDSKIAKIAYLAETKELGIKGGWQDQYAAVTGGFNFIEFSRDGNLVTPLRLKEDIIDELAEHLSLCYTGGKHLSGDVQTETKRTFDNNEVRITQNLKLLKQMAIEIKNSLLNGELEKIGPLLHESWINKKKLSSGISSPRIDTLYETGIKNGAHGGKLLGAGGAGYLLFFHPPKKRNSLVQAVEDIGGEFLDFDFDLEGAKTWHVRTS